MDDYDSPMLIDSHQQVRTPEAPIPNLWDPFSWGAFEYSTSGETICKLEKIYIPKSDRDWETINIGLS